MDLRPYYFKQTVKKGCSAQSVAIIYNYFYKENPIFDQTLLLEYKDWNKLIRRKNGIGIDNLAKFVSLVFGGINVNVYHSPLSVSQLKKNIKNKFIIIYYNRHYTPVLYYDNKTNEIYIGKNKTHEIIIVNLNDFLPYINSYIAF